LSGRLRILLPGRPPFSSGPRFRVDAVAGSAAAGPAVSGPV